MSAFGILLVFVGVPALFWWLDGSQERATWRGHLETFRRVQAENDRERGAK